MKNPEQEADKIISTYESALRENTNLIIRGFFGTEYAAAAAKSSAEGITEYKMNVSNLKNEIYYLEFNGAEVRL